MDDQLKDMLSNRVKDESQTQGVVTGEVVSHGGGDLSRTNNNSNPMASSTPQRVPAFSSTTAPGSGSSGTGGVQTRWEVV